MFAKHLHRIGAVILVVFIVTHLSVHLFALAGTTGAYKRPKICAVDLS